MPQRSLRLLGFFASRALGTRITARASRGDASNAQPVGMGCDAYLLGRHLDLLCVLEAREIKGEYDAPAPVFRERCPWQNQQRSIESKITTRGCCLSE